jgi:uncharacterized membrane protein YbhN (UPF0104 family)
MRADTSFCTVFIKGKEWAAVTGKGRRWMNLFVINHYKIWKTKTWKTKTWKTKTWKTATGEAKGFLFAFFLKQLRWVCFYFHSY